MEIINATFHYHYFPQPWKETNLIHTKTQRESRLFTENVANELTRSYGQANG
jgi:hypothetical protein